MRSYRVAYLPGDGIGPEVCGVARRTVDAAGERFGFAVTWDEQRVGGAAIDADGMPLPAATLDACRSADAVLLGAVGGPRWDDPSAHHRPEDALLALRSELELFANLRPVKAHPALASASPIRPEIRDGMPLPAATLDACRSADAVLLGAVGGPRWDDPSADHRPEDALLALRSELELFANLRPVKAHPALASASPIRPEIRDGADLLILRELTGGLYFGRPQGRSTTEDGTESAVDTLRYTRPEIERIVELGFELAEGRRGRLTSVDKANVLASSRLWREVVNEVAERHPSVRVDHALVDSTAYLVLTQPTAYDVIVTENLFGDILSDEAAAIAGSLGLLASASLGTRTTATGRFGLYEPVHGSAPSIAGEGLANPIATVASAAMLLRWSLGEGAAADVVEAAVDAAIADGPRTGDLGGSDGTESVAGFLLARIDATAEVPA